MPHNCCVTSCKNNVGKGYRLFKIPSNPKRKQIWLDLIARPNLHNEARICEVHFSEEQFENARLDGRKLLKPFAVPDVLYSTNSGNKRKCEKLVRTNENEAAESSTSKDSLNDVSLDVSYENAEYSNNEASHEDSFLNCLNDDDELDDELLTSLKNTEDLVGSLRKIVKSLSRKCRYYEKKLKQIRKRQPIPDARLFKVSLRLVCLSQFQSSLKKTSYSDSESTDLISYCNELNNVLGKPHEQIEDEIMYEMDQIINENNFVAETTSDIQPSIYYLLGSIILKIKKNFTHCEHCYQTVQTNPEEINDLNLFTKLKEFKENALVFPTLELFHYICKVETEYRIFENQIISNTLTLENFLSHIHNMHTAPTIPTCHEILKKIVKVYVRSRIYFYLNSRIDPTTSTGKDSRSMAMRINLK